MNLFYFLTLVQQPPSRRIGSIADYDPLNENYGSLATGYRNAMPMSHDVSNIYRGRFSLCVYRV